MAPIGKPKRRIRVEPLPKPRREPERNVPREEPAPAPKRREKVPV
jgi:hypothetical protein